MIEIERFHEIMNALADELPEKLCEGLSGGIVLHEELMISPHATNNDLVVCGMYIRNNLGCQIAIYYGSFAQTYGYLSEEDLINKMREILRHELRHHIEFKSGIRDLEVEDEEFIRQYLERQA